MWNRRTFCSFPLRTSVDDRYQEEYTHEAKDAHIGCGHGHSFTRRHLRALSGTGQRLDDVELKS